MPQSKFEFYRAEWSLDRFRTGRSYHTEERDPARAEPVAEAVSTLPLDQRSILGVRDVVGRGRLRVRELLYESRGGS